MSARIYFKVTRHGFCTDGARYPAGVGTLIEFELPKSLANLVAGDRISLPAEDTPRGTYIDSNDIFIESGPQMGQERPEFASAGPDVAGTWAPRTGNPSYVPAGVKSDDGRFSHREERFKK